MHVRAPRKQQGLGWFGLLLVFGIIGLAAIVVVKCLPLYLNQMKIASAVKGVAEDSEMGAAEATTIRSFLQRRWDIEDITMLEPKDIKVKRTERGRELSYDYEARVNLFYNIYVVIHFKDDVRMRSSPGGG